ASCKCDDDGPDVRSATFTGTVDFWNCNEGWEKCTAVYTPVASCCRKKK
uniref:Delta-stichotoxin-Hmg4a n=1 Tax=Heteractis magnifica TaxID=38281 RepID=4AD_HETMG|nr:RecName: Full=Delta-stichotoxin-Hmg4a; Short=Delta-SHTX-Hmg4a; AltName: Full=Delta-stichotoxin-Rpa1a; Short=Delta-SHTX-Rpa1a; AltName: Full=RpII; AltName: Full=Toxin II [Heteractis magnifica]